MRILHIRLPGLVNNLAGKLIANFWLDSVYTKKEGDAHRNGDYHIHDLDCLAAYCCGHDLQRLLKEGFNGVLSRVGSKPPKHVREALYQMANFIGILQAEWAGAQAFSSFDTFLAPLVFFDIYFGGLTEDDIKKAVCNFVYNLNVPSRWGQSPFSNITIDINCPRDLAIQMPMRGETGFFNSIKEEYQEYFNTAEELINKHLSPEEILKQDKNGLEAINRWHKWQCVINELRNRIEGSEDMDEDTLLFSVNYKIFEPEMHLITKAYYEVMNSGDAFGLPFTFPIPTVNITEDFNWESEIADLVFENAAKYGSSYFQNFIGSQFIRNPETGKLERNPNAYKPSDVRSMCCRLQLDKTQIRKKLEKRGGGLFGSDAQTGSIGVVTINMARLGYNFKGNMKGLYKQLFKLMDLAKSTLEKKRKFVVSMNERGLYPYTHRYVRTFDTYFSTIGVNGINEMIRNFTNNEYDIADPRGQKMANEVLDAIRERLIQYQEETGNMYNLEATPAEGTTYRLAKEDAKRYSARKVKFINCPIHGKVEVTTDEDEVVCPLCEKEANKK